MQNAGILQNAQKLKGWINFNGTGVIAINAQNNVASLDDDGVGKYTINWLIPFANVNYVLSGMGKIDSGNTNNQVPIIGLDRVAGNPAVGSATINTTDMTGTAQDCEIVMVKSAGVR